MKRIKFFLIAFFVSLPLYWGINFFQENLEQFFYAQISEPFQNISEIKIPQKPAKPELNLEAKSAFSIQIKKNNKEVIAFKKNSKEILAIASLTKLMTAVIVLENEIYDLENTQVTISKTAAKQENVPNYGNLDLEIGKKFDVGKLLDLILVYSSNDAAFALSEVMGVENFVMEMNRKAAELGLENTHLVNPTGLDPENIFYNQETFDSFNYSTTENLVKLSQYILKNHPLIFEISLRKGPYPFTNGVSSLVLQENQTALGGKTGYTDEAGGCILVVFRNEKENIFFNVILGTKSQTARVAEMQKLIDWLSL